MIIQWKSWKWDCTFLTIAWDHILYASFAFFSRFSSSHSEKLSLFFFFFGEQQLSRQSLSAYFSVCTISICYLRLNTFLFCLQLQRRRIFLLLLLLRRQSPVIAFACFEWRWATVCMCVCLPKAVILYRITISIFRNRCVAVYFFSLFVCILVNYDTTHIYLRRILFISSMWDIRILCKWLGANAVLPLPLPCVFSLRFSNFMRAFTRAFGRSLCILSSLILYIL